MASIFALIRPILAIFLAIAVCIGFFLFLVERTISGKLLDHEFYASVFDEQDAYGRFYDQVLMDDLVREAVSETLRVGPDIMSHEELIGVVEDIMPRTSLQGHVEGGLSQTSRYINGDSLEFRIYVDLSRELASPGPAVLGFLEARIDGIPLELEGDRNCSASGAAELAASYADRAGMLREGRVPESIPSLESLSRPCRELVSVLALDGLVEYAGLDQRMARGLLDHGDEIRAQFVEGNSHGVVKSIVRPLVQPLIDDAIARARDELDDRYRLELVDQLAGRGGGPAAKEFQDFMEDIRRWVLRGSNLARTAVWVFLFGGGVLLVLVYLPRLSTGLRWLGVTFIIAGGLSLIGAKVVQTNLADRAALLVDAALSSVPDFPVSLTELISDIAVSSVRQLAEGIADWSLIALLVGTVIFAASFLTWSTRRWRS